jgi:hypothetical protein
MKKQAIAGGSSPSAKVRATRPSLEDGGDQECLVVPLRGVAEGLLPRERLGAPVVSEDVADLDPVGQRFDSGDIDLLELLDVVHDLVDLFGIGREFVRIEAKAGQQGDLGDILGAEVHGRGSRAGKGVRDRSGASSPDGWDAATIRDDHGPLKVHDRLPLGSTRFDPSIGRR